mmetsp:Transcript_63548/g.124779  ORF Transcript_63548/g.124779 Transcript_63548/m.124779 type:complete len:474 (+) Transcript_63548:171-1592(+)
MATLESLEGDFLQIKGDFDTLWLMIGTFLVFIMQAGFAMVEVGNVDSKNTHNILLKNILDASLGSVLWWLVGYGVAFGSSPSQLIGTDKFLLRRDDFGGDSGYNYAFWLFQWAFAATAATIVSGSVAERCTIIGYIAYAICLITFIYPMVVQMAWGSNGYMSPWLGSDKKDDYFVGCGVIDFAGSGVVHLTGGVAAFVGIMFLGPRRSFVNGTINVPEYGPVFQTLGTILLWFGWFGFNGASTLALFNYGELAAKVLVNTTLAAGSGALGTLIIGSMVDTYFLGRGIIRLEFANNGVLCGLVAITAGCAVVEPYAAALIGFFSSFVYLGSSKLLLYFGIDDVVNAVPVHGACGAYGVFCAGLFATKHNYKMSYNPWDGSVDHCAGVFYGGGGSQLAANCAFICAVVAWVGCSSIIMFGCLNLIGCLRISPEVEDLGLDASEHGITNITKSPEDLDSVRTDEEQSKFPAPETAD